MVKTYVFQVLILARNQALISLPYIFQGYCPFTVSGATGPSGSQGSVVLITDLSGGVHPLDQLQ